MEESGSHQPTIGPYQDNVNPHQVESGGSQHNNSVVNPQQRGGKSHVSHTKNERDMQHEIDELKKELRRAQRRRPSPDSELSSEKTNDATYRQRSRTPPSETFSGDEEHRHKRKGKNLTHKGIGNNAMNEVLN